MITYQVHQNLSNSGDKRQSWPWKTTKHEGAIFLVKEHIIICGLTPVRGKCYGSKI